MTAGATWRPLRSGGREAELRTRGDQPDPRGVYLCPSVGEYPLYDAAIYEVISGDEQRNRLFQRAIEDAVPGATVLEIGPGPDLLWSLAAVRAGATRVYAAEVLAESARLAQETARRHPDAPIEVLTGDATGIALPQRAGVCIAEIVGCLGGAEGMAAVLADAERRHLTEDAQVIPAGVRTLVAAVSLADALAAGGAVDGQPALAGMFAPYVESIFRAAGGPFDVRMCLAGARPDLLRSSAGVVEDLRFGAFGAFGAEGSSQRGGDLRLEVTRPGPVDAVLAWIELTVTPGDRVMDSLADETNWLPVCIPFAGGAVPAGAGDVLALRATVHEGEDGIHPEYFFRGELTRDDGRAGVPVYAESRFSGGPFRATPLHRALLR